MARTYQTVRRRVCPMQATTIAIIAAATIVAVIAALLNFRFLLYPLIPSLNPTAHKERLQLKGRTLFISDLHLEADRPFKYAKDLHGFVEGRKISNLVVNGDLFNSPEDALAIFRDVGTNGLKSRLGLGDLGVGFFWVIGSPPHDVAISAGMSNLVAVRVLGNCVSVDFSDAKILLYHGHDLSVKGAIGHGWNRFISKLSLERAWKRLAKVDEHTWVFFGHTHIPGVDTKRRVANSGGWQRVPFVHPTKTGLLMSEGQTAPELVTIV